MLRSSALLPGQQRKCGLPHGLASSPGVLPQPAPSLRSRQQLLHNEATSLRRSVKLHGASVATAGAAVADDQMTREYNQTMQTQMQWGLNPYTYHPSRGLYYNEIVPGLICGTQPRTAADVSTLAREVGVTHILNLQTDKDMQHWSVSIDELQRSCSQHGVTHMRRSARDFDPLSLRKALPGAVSAVRHALAAQGKVYVHCTAGLGRAPAVCIAYMYWFLEMELDQAYQTLTDIRPCGPKRDAIRGATFDLLSGAPADQFDHLGQDAWASLAKEDKFALQWRVLKSG